MSSTITALPLTATLADDLERTRLEHRARRLEMVLKVLRTRVRSHPAPELLGRAIGGFEHELHAVRHQLSGPR